MGQGPVLLLTEKLGAAKARREIGTCGEAQAGLEFLKSGPQQGSNSGVLSRAFGVGLGGLKRSTDSHRWSCAKLKETAFEVEKEEGRGEKSRGEGPGGDKELNPDNIMKGPQQAKLVVAESARPNPYVRRKPQECDPQRASPGPPAGPSHWGSIPRDRVRRTTGRQHEHMSRDLPPPLA